MNQSDNRDILQKLIPALPSALGNLAKGYELAVNPEEQLRTSTGKVIVDPNSVQPEEILGQAMGFSPQRFQDARQQMYWQQTATNEFNQARSRFAESVAHALWLKEQASRNGDPEAAQQANAQRAEIQKTMINYMKENKIPMDGKFWSSFNNNVSQRLTQKRFPGKIIKPSKGELRHIEALTSDD